MPKQTPNRLIKTHQNLIGKMVQSFITQAVGQPAEKINELYNSFEDDWKRRVKKVNSQYGEYLLSFDVWDRTWKEDGYIKILTIPVPKQLPEEQKELLKSQKIELMRIVFIVEGKTEQQRQRREHWYKVWFIGLRIKMYFKSLLGLMPKIKPVDVKHPKMEIVK